MPILDIFDAIIRKDEDTLQSLLEKRSRDINKISLHNHTPLGLAASYGKIDIVKLLIEFGADVNQSDSIGRTPLMRACSFTSNDDTADYLISCGAKVNARHGGNGKTALHYAIKNKRFALAKRLVKYRLKQQATCQKTA